MKYLILFPLAFGLLLFSAGCPTEVGGTGGGGSGAGGGDHFNACTGPGQCILTFPGCCDGCGVPELGDVVAIHKDNFEAFHQSACPNETECPKCASVINPNLFAYCDLGTCKAADTRTHHVGACVSDTDCRLRIGTSCCESCIAASTSDLTAVSTSSELESLVCEPMTGCPACAPQYPPEASAFCADGQCAVVIAL